MYYLLALNEICQVFRCVHREDRKRKPSNICHPHSVPPKHDKVKEIASSRGILGGVGGSEGNSLRKTRAFSSASTQMDVDCFVSVFHR